MGIPWDLVTLFLRVKVKGGMTVTEILIEGVMIGIEGNEETWTIEIKDHPEMIETMTAEDQIVIEKEIIRGIDLIEVIEEDIDLEDHSPSKWVVYHTKPR